MPPISTKPHHFPTWDAKSSFTTRPTLSSLGSFGPVTASTLALPSTTTAAFTSMTTPPRPRYSPTPSNYVTLTLPSLPLPPSTVSPKPSPSSPAPSRTYLQLSATPNWTPSPVSKQCLESGNTTPQTHVIHLLWYPPRICGPTTPICPQMRYPHLPQIQGWSHPRIPH